MWAWERPEDLRFLPADTEVAVQTGFVSLSGSDVTARGRRFTLLADRARVTMVVVHVQIDPRRPPVWTPDVRARLADAVVAHLGAETPKTVQIDLEVRASQRQMLLDLLTDVRARLPSPTRLSMTALASWCETETWLSDAPVDEIAPMLFRMGATGARMRAKLAAGGDFTNPRCRTALAVSSDAPIVRAPAGRRVYLFDPQGWTPAVFETVRERVTGWAQGG